jgi:hypothetical protein
MLMFGKMGCAKNDAWAQPQNQQRQRNECIGTIEGNTNKPHDEELLSGSVV